ncbi:uncharacterized protein LOC143211552 [Lasioglossum baleicum]|uniref:uncharacterized protein LOC143211552 n=1 Tax=Lasioglossum baleicum TaxID=434251 RepID=UPI003FCC3DD4
MLDGKAFGAVTNSSLQSCAICGATPKVMNNISSILSRKCDDSRYEYGLSILHAHIRSLEFMLHISYRLDIQKWQIRDEEDKLKFHARKKHIQHELKIQLGLLVDIPKPNYGTSNDGNTARKFFINYEKVASITGVDSNLIRRFGVILATISSGCAIDVDAFYEYSIKTAKTFFNLYQWYYMPSSIHRILIHGSNIIKAFNLPIGMMSEEPLEARNKDLRRFKENNMRKSSRAAGITDLLHNFLFTSDPLISGILCKQTKLRTHKKTVFENEMKTLLLYEDNDDNDVDDNNSNLNNDNSNLDDNDSDLDDNDDSNMNNEDSNLDDANSNSDEESEIEVFGNDQ